MTRAQASERKPETWPCVCAFARSVNERDRFAFDNAGMMTDVMLRDRFVIKHRKSGVHAYQPKTQNECCPAWFGAPAFP